MGEYDRTTGLTYVTRQRGRLHFHMGANAIKHAHAAAAAARAQCETQAQDDAMEPSDPKSVASATKDLLALHLRTGAFTGLALYPEEAYYLLQRGALVIFTMEQQAHAASKDTVGTGHYREPQPLSVAHFVALLLRYQKASLACLDVYAFLKENQFHPRRHREEITLTYADIDQFSKSSDVTTSQEASSAVTYSQPQHYRADADSACQFAYDVWKSSTETLYVPNEDHKAATASAEELQQETNSASEPPAVLRPSVYVKRKKDTSTKKRKVKRLRLVFRVLVCRFADVMPPPSALVALVATNGSEPLAGGGSGGPHVPVKVAVVDQDKSVLFFEVG